MKKTALAAAMLLGLSPASFAQEYHPLLNNTSWVVNTASFLGEEFYIVQPGIDVVINNKAYKSFHDPVFGEMEIFVREDVEEQKVYRLINGEDVLMLDFKLQLGESIVLGNGHEYTVIEVSNIPVADGTTRKMISLADPNGIFLGETWIESVGNYNDPLRPQFELPSDPYITTQCSFNNWENVYNFGLANGGMPTACMFLGNDGFGTTEAKLSPNPFTTSAILQSRTGFSDATIRIYNQIGQLVKEMKNGNGNEIEIGRDALANGIYVLQLLESGRTSTQKIMIAD